MILLFSALGLLAAVVAYDLVQRQHAILRNFPIVGHFRYWLEAVGPELRQYIVTNNNEERPFSRDQRRWVYTSSKRENNYFGFGSDQDMELQPNFLVIKHNTFPLPTPLPGDPAYDPSFTIACAKVLGAARGRAKAFRPPSIVNVSGMSFGSLSGPAVEALNGGSGIAGCLHNTGEGGVSPYHLQGGDLVWQLGTGYFGCRDADGRFSMTRLKETVERCPQIRAIEIKLSQGAKPGLGGLLPQAKISVEIELVDNRFGSKTVAKLFGYGRGFGLPSDVDAEEVCRLMSDQPDRPTGSGSGKAASGRGSERREHPAVSAAIGQPRGESDQGARAGRDAVIPVDVIRVR